MMYKPVLDLAWKDLTTKDVVKMHRMGISTNGSWAGVNTQDALNKMMQDYYQRLVAQAFGLPKKEIEDERRSVVDSSPSPS